MKDRLIALSLLLGAAVFAPHAPAQRRGGFAAAPAFRGGVRIAPGGGYNRGGYGVRAGRYFAGAGYAPGFYSYPSYSSYSRDFYSGGYSYDSGAGQGVAPAQVTYVAPPPKPAVPLILELRGDRWVRIASYDPAAPAETAGRAAAPESDSAVRAASSARSSTTSAARSESSSSAGKAAAVLVFRDGHQEEIGQYRIMGATIYLNTDYWTSGAWTRTVPVAALDVAATLRLNQQRGTNFRLPSGPDEIMIGG